ncbi:MAG: hypothetical protein ACREU2_09665 [Steroidobacteraceae bacterium]
MKFALTASAVLAAAICAMTARASPGPTTTAPIQSIETPRDRAYPGEIHLMVDGSDVIRRIIHVHETITAGHDQR